MSLGQRSEVSLCYTMFGCERKSISNAEKSQTTMFMLNRKKDSESSKVFSNILSQLSFVRL